MGEGWAWDDLHYYFSAQKSPFPIYGNLMRFTRDNFTQKIKPFPPLKLPQNTTHFGLKENSYNLPSLLDKLTTKDTLFIPFDTQKIDFAKLLSLAIDRKVTRETMPLPSHLPPKRWFSPATDKLYRAMMHDSDNLIAESLLLMVGESTIGKLSTAETILYLKQNGGIPFDSQMRWVDGSGLSRYNLLSPEIIVKALRTILNIRGWDATKTLFPTTGQGTMENSFQSIAMPVVYAKTGTLNNNFCLSGYFVSKKGRRFIFSIMVNHHMSSKKAVTNACTQLLQWYWRKA